MIPTLVWTVAGAYFAVSLFWSDLFHRIWSLSILSLFYLGGGYLGGDSWPSKTYAVWDVLNLACCVILSPLQVLLFRKYPQQVWIETVRSDENAEIDIVAVHGLGSNAETAWSKGKHAPHWLRDFLPDENGLKARILLYYHNSQWNSHSLDLSIDDIARDLLRAIKSSRHDLEDTERTNRPLVFIGYSFGGILVKKAMLLDAKSAETIVRPESTGCLFIGTPHRGSAFAYAGILTALLGYWSGSSPILLEDLRGGSPLLRALQIDFREAFQAHGDRIINCRETGTEYWLGMPLLQVVTRDNADLGIGRDVPIDESHRELRRVDDRRHPTYQKLLSYIKELVGKVRRPPAKFQVESAFGLSEERQYQLLNGISHAVGAAYDHCDQSHQECEEGTRVELLATMQKWAEDSSAERGFWIVGMAGTGKSTIAITMARKLAKTGFAIGSFFFRRGAGDRSRASKLVLTIARQLSTFPMFKPLIADALHLNLGIQEKTLQDQWDVLVRRPISANGVAKNVPIMLIVDAIDECERNTFGHHEAVDFLSRESNFEGLDLRIIATSRPQLGPHTQQTLGSSERAVYHPRFLLHDIDDNIVEADIRTFLRANFQRLQANKEMPKSFPQEDHIEALTKKSSPLFIAARTSLLFIQRNKLNPMSHFDLLMNQSGSGAPVRTLNSIYVVVIKEALFEQFGQGDSFETAPETLSDILAAFQTYMGTLLVLQEALSYHDLALLVAADPEEVQIFFSIFTSVIETPDDTNPIRILHQSFRDFLLSEESVKIACDMNREGQRLDYRDLWVDAKQRHALLLLHCLQAMEGRQAGGGTACLKQDIFDLRNPWSSPDDIDPANRQEEWDRCMPRYLEYACRYWPRHFLHSGCSEHQEVLLDFLKGHVLHWIEAMSWLGKEIEVINLLDELYAEANKAGSSISSRLTELLSDTRMFVRRHKGAMEDCPLQLYSSALQFSPKRFRSYPAHEDLVTRHGMIRSTSYIEKDWTSCLLSFEGHAKLGKHLEIRTMQFSNDRTFIVSLDESGTVLVWDVQNGAILMQLENVSVPPARERIGGFSLSKTDLVAFCGTGQEGLKIWDVRRNEYMARLPGSEHADLPVVFGPDDETIASTIRGETVGIWNIRDQDKTKPWHKDREQGRSP